MATPLLSTKFHIPLLRREWVRRPRLIRRLDEGLDCKLTLLSAPAGSGKSTLLGEWIHAHEADAAEQGAGGPFAAPVYAWVSLDAGDNDLYRFLTYVVSALQRAVGDFGEATLAALQSSRMPTSPAPRAPQVEGANAAMEQIEGALTGLINEIAALDSGPIVLILDDYHVIRERGIHAALTYLLDYLPSQMHLVLATRADPPLPVARLRARGQLVELRQADLRFSPDEAAEYLNRVMGLGLSAGEVETLASRTEGWIAGLRMAAASMQGREDVAGFIRAFTGSDRHVLDYLVEEVLQRQPEGIQTFLLRTSVLDRLTGPLCDALGGCAPGGPFADSGEILEHLERANLFIVPLDEERRWYRYHRLFADLLGQRLRRLGPELVPDLHRRASEWYEGQSRMERADHPVPQDRAYAGDEYVSAAIDHALSAREPERAARLIEGVCEELLAYGERAALVKWTEALPDDVVRARPRLCVTYAGALLFGGGPAERVESRLHDAAAADDAGHIAGELAAYRSLLATYRADVPQMAELALQALERLPEESLLLRGIVANNLGVARLMSGDLERATHAFEQVVRTAQETGLGAMAVGSLCNLAGLCMLHGQLDQAQETYRQALDLAVDGRGRRLPIAAKALLGLGEIARERNGLDAATCYLTEAIERMEQYAPVGALAGYLSLSSVQQARGDVEGARHLLDKAGEVAARSNATDVDDLIVAALRARLELKHGDLGAAERWARERGWTEAALLPDL